MYTDVGTYIYTAVVTILWHTPTTPVRRKALLRICPRWARRYPESTLGEVNRPRGCPLGCVAKSSHGGVLRTIVKAAKTKHDRFPILMTVKTRPKAASP